jgi:transcription-repair coupling factor (superfamily II helicase)
MLDEAIRELRGERRQIEVEPEIQLGIPAYVPDAYVPDVNQRLLLYKRLAGIRGVPDLDAIRDELLDRYGPIPPLVDTLLALMSLRRRLKDLHVTQARRRGDGVLVEFAPSTPVQVTTLLEFIRGSKGRLRLVSESALLVRPEATDHDGVIAELASVLQKLASA